jgi:hypothetical protein
MQQRSTPFVTQALTCGNTQAGLKSHLSSILIEIENLSPHAIRTLTTSYMEQIQALQAQLSNIDISSIKTVTTNIDSFSTSMQSLQSHINSQDRIKTSSNDHWHTANRHRESTLENLAIESTKQLLRRFGDAKQADQYAGGNCRKINSINQQLERLETRVAEIRLKPKPATNFSYLRSDGYYPDYVAYHKELSDKQQKAYENKKPLQLIDYIQKKSENLETYMRRASANLNKWDYEKFEEIIKNDQQMLKYLQCEKILEPQNDHLEQQRTSYQACLKSFENIKSDIYEIKNPSAKRNVSEKTYEHEHKPKSKNDFDLDF